MSQDFKLRLQEFRQQRPAAPEQPEAEGAPALSNHAYYETPGPVRNLCLVWLDGRETFLNYAYLVEAEFSPGDQLNEIVLNFSGYAVGLRGYMLETLFAELLDHRPRMIFQIDPRYLDKQELQEAIVTEIVVVRPT